VTLDISQTILLEQLHQSREAPATTGSGTTLHPDLDRIGGSGPDGVANGVISNRFAVAKVHT